MFIRMVKLKDIFLYYLIVLFVDISCKGGQMERNLRDHVEIYKFRGK